MTSSEEAFCLQWNDFKESISSSLGELYHCSDLQDVTLQCGQESLQCHRFVLAACSTWFRQIFKTLNTSNRHPVIVMWETAARDMSLLLDFMYNGVVNVKQENLNGFLALAERLSVRGLTQNQTENKKPSAQQLASSSQSTSQISSRVSTNRVSSKPATSSHVELGKEVDLGMTIVKQEHVKEDFQLEQETYDENYYEEPETYEEAGIEGVNFDQNSGIMNNKDRTISLSELPTTGGGVCPFCCKTISGNIRRHVEDLHVHGEYPCSYCGKIFSSKNKLSNHGYHCKEKRKMNQHF